MKDSWASYPPWYHVIWTTRLSWPPKDRRGDWRDLGSLYDEYGAPTQMSDPLPTSWLALPPPAGALVLSPDARQQLLQDIRELAADDRIAGDTPLAAVAIAATSVQLVLSCPPEVLHRRVGRLKSRTATLLEFTPTLRMGGKGTWGKGIWWSRLDDPQLFRAVSSFVLAHGSAP